MSAIISLGARTYLRSVASRNFTSTAQVLRHAVVDSDFGMSETWTTITTVGCWIRQMNNPDIKPDVGGLYVLGVFRVLMPFDTDCRPGDELLIDGATYLVQNTNSEDTNRVSLVCVVQKLEGN